MAITATNNDSKIKLGLNAGTDENGKEIVKSKTFSKVKADATNEDVYAATTAISNLQTLPLMSVKRINEVELREE